MRKITALLSVMALAISTTAVSAATFTLTPVVTGSFQPDFTPIPGAPDTTSINGVMRVFQIDMVVSVANLQAGERGFGNVGYNMGLDGITEGGAGGYQPNTATTDSNGGAPGGIVPLFSTNADAGPSPTDLQGMFTTIAGGISAPNASDERVRVGQPGSPNVLGSVFVKWNATAPGKFSVLNSSWSVYSTAGSFSGSQGTGGEVIFGIPEPATFAMGGMGLVGMLAVARRRKA